MVSTTTRNPHHKAMSVALICSPFSPKLYLTLGAGEDVMVSDQWETST
jgi:hypothetical protein